PVFTSGIDHERLTSQLRFVLEADKLKRVLRRSLLIDGARRENSAEHSWHVTVLARVFAEYAPEGTDIDHVVNMLVVHDIVEIDDLQPCLRRSVLIDGARREYSAEHSWHVSVLARVFAVYAPEGTDIDHVVNMLVVHDIVEIDAGDTFVYDRAAVRSQAERERAAADRIFALLPEDQAAWARSLWDEFEERKTPEARF